MKRELPREGDVFEIPYPFVRDTYTEHIQDEDGWAPIDRSTWRPGIRDVPAYNGDHHTCVADAMGAQVVTVHGTFKPGKFPRRVFFTRQWRDPDGKVFGKKGCRITTINAWWSLLNGFRVPFTLDDTPRLEAPIPERAA